MKAEERGAAATSAYGVKAEGRGAAATAAYGLMVEGRGAAATSGLEVVGRGMTTTIYRDGNKAVKLYAGVSPEDVCREAYLQRFARGAGLPAPAVLGVRILDRGTVALDMDYISGEPLMRPGMGETEAVAAVRTLVNLQRRVHGVNAAGLPGLNERLGRRIKNADEKYVNAETKRKLLSALARLGDNSENLCHGDFHPLNILYDGAGYWIIDWVDAAAGNPLADACRTYLIFEQHLPGLSDAYLQTFCGESGSKRDDVLAWLWILAAVRLDEKQDDGSRAKLLEILERGGRGMG